ncbi:hypothetical protein BH10CYA1_BH10CYA1_60480 [soil metagenome]
MFNQVAGRFDALEKAKNAVSDITVSKLHGPASTVTVRTNISNRYGYTDPRYLTRLFTAWIVLGTLVGVGYVTEFLRPEGLGSTIGAALAFGAFGAAAGQLIAGLFDIVFGGSLDDRLDLEEPTIYTVAADVPLQLTPVVEKLMQQNGAKAVYNFTTPTKALTKKNC